MVSVTGRVLTPPDLLYDGGGKKQKEVPVTPSNGSWGMGPLKLLQSPPQRLERWVGGRERSVGALERWVGYY
jgi:hypothetical protein